MTDEHKQNTSTASRKYNWREVAYLFSCLVIVGTLILLAYSFGIVLCPLKKYTGIPCPTCGATRAVLSAFHGDFYEAFKLQPLVMTVAVMAGPVALAAALSQRVKHVLAMTIRYPLTWFFAALLLATNWVYVIINGN